MNPSTPAAHQAGSVVSRDGTAIGYRQYGSGPGIVIVHGGMQASQHYTRLAAALADSFTLYVPDRRGRGMSGSHGSSYGIARECEDMAALLDQTGARFVFGLSSGALVCLQSALTLPAVEKAALYEPPLSINGSTPASWVARYDQEIAQGRLASALVTALKGTQVDPVLAALPRFIAVPFFWTASRFLGNGDGEVPIRALIPTQHFDMQLVAEMSGTLETFRAVRAKVLLLGGGKSPGFLRVSLDALGSVLPHSTRITFPALGHSGPDNDGKPELVAEELRRFYGA